MNRVRPELNSATTTTRAASPEQERLARILDDYLVAIEQGKSVDPEELLAKYPEDAAQLRGYLSGLQLFHAAAVPTQAIGELSSTGVPAALQTIGDYRLVREIGRGGMGVVYEAWQVSLRRRVALKVLPFTSANDAKQIGRFKNEAQSAAQVQHPNIVPVFAVGEENGTHYYVMQLIEGQSLTSLLGALRGGGDPECGSTAPNHAVTYDARGEDIPVCQQQLKQPQPTKRTQQTKQSRQTGMSVPREHVGGQTLPMRSSETADHICVVARLAIQAAEALHAAHEYGVVHRDVKPSNLLLDDQGKLWVTDFGLARCRENQGLTQTGDVLGTMRYMSPEQALGRKALVDQRTDVYSLGITMYELATLNHPADELNDMQLLFDRNRQSAKPLRHWNRHIPRDFETIVLKCMAEFPHERYSTARELAEDMERFLEGRPIVASPPSLVSRVTKWAKRRRRVVYAAAVVLLIAVGGLFVNRMQLAKSNAVKVRALAQAAERLHEMGNVLDRSTEYAQQLAAIPGAGALSHKLLEDSVELYRKFESQAVDDPSFLTDSANANSKLGALNEKLGNLKEALKWHARARDEWQERVAEQPTNREYARQLALSQNNLGYVIAEDGRPAEALALLSAACGSQMQLQAVNPDWTEIATDLGTTHGNLGLVLRQSGESEKAAKEFNEAIAILEPIAKSAPTDAVVLRSLAASYNNLASLEDAGKPPLGKELRTKWQAAADAYKKAISIQRDLVKTDPLNRFHQSDLARTYNNLGDLATRSEDRKNAERCYADAIQLRENLVKSSPSVGVYRRDLAISYNNLGMTQSRDNHLAEAEASYQKAARLQSALLKAQPNDVQTLSNQGGVWNNLGMLFDRQQRTGDAAKAYQQAIHFQNEALARATSNDNIRALLSRHYFNYAQSLVAQAKYGDAVQTALERKELWPGNAERLYSVAQELADIYRKMNGKSGVEEATPACIQAAAATLREALAAGLSRDRLKDASLSGLVENSEFRQLMDDNKVGQVTPASTLQTRLTRVN